MSDEKKPVTKKEKYSKLAANKAQEETKSKQAKKSLLTGKDQENNDETITHAETDANDDTNAKTKDVSDNELNQNVQQETFEDDDKEKDIRLYADPALELIQVVATGNKKKKLEDVRIRSTYWLMPEERKMVNKLHKETGYVKYDVVGMAIRSMYDRVMAAKKEKKKKKPDQQ